MCMYPFLFRYFDRPCNSKIEIYQLIFVFTPLLQFDGAYDLLKDMKKINLTPTAGIYNAIMGGYFREVTSLVYWKLCCSIFLLLLYFLIMKGSKWIVFCMRYNTVLLHFMVFWCILKLTFLYIYSFSGLNLYIEILKLVPCHPFLGHLVFRNLNIQSCIHRTDIHKHASKVHLCGGGQVFALIVVIVFVNDVLTM